MATGGGVIPVRMAFSSEAELRPRVKERTRMKKAARWISSPTLFT